MSEARRPQRQPRKRQSAVGESASRRATPRERNQATPAEKAALKAHLERPRRAKTPALLPEPPEQVEVLWSRLQEHLGNLDPGDAVHRIITAERYDSTIGALCDAVDERTRSKTPRAYSSREMEALNLLRGFVGKKSYKETRDWLTSDRGARARELLGFDQPRPEYGRKVRKLMAGVPSQSSMSRHLRRLTEEERLAAWLECFELSSADNIEALGLALLPVGLDGSEMPIHHKAEIRNPATGEVVNTSEVTAPEAGYRARNEDDDHKGGHGFQILTALGAGGLPLIFDVRPMNEGESTVAREMFEQQWERIRSHLPSDGPMPLVDADAGFASPHLRRTLHELGIVERISKRSASDGEISTKRVDYDRNSIWQIDEFPNWRANGLRDIFCMCGEGTTFRRFERTSRGKAVCRVEGVCKTCGPISITAGDWRTAQNPRRFTRCVDDADRARADWSFGNPLTFDDPLAKKYARKRFASIEGFHSILERRFGIVKGKRWIRRQAQAHIEVAIAFTIMHELVIQQREMAAEAEVIALASGPPPLPLAA